MCISLGRTDIDTLAALWRAYKDYTDRQSDTEASGYSRQLSE